MAQAWQPDWPMACEHIEGRADSSIVLLCEHASNFVPAEYDQLGLDAASLTRHIALDIGAADVTRRLAAKLQAPAFLGTYSRLLIDLNRPPESSTSIPLVSEDITIPGNAGLPASEIARRQSLILEPYHTRVQAHLDMRQKHGLATRIVTVHSFTPVFLGVARPWHVGVLFGKSRTFAEGILAELRRDSRINAALNQPYVVSRGDDYAIPRHGDDRGIEAVLLEIRNDLIAHAAGAEEWATRFAGILAPNELRLGAAM